jgi:hypothetical protein
MSAIESYSTPNRLDAPASRATRPVDRVGERGEHDAERGEIVAPRERLHDREEAEREVRGGDQVREQQQPARLSAAPAAPTAPVRSVELRLVVQLPTYWDFARLRLAARSLLGSLALNSCCGRPAASP